MKQVGAKRGHEEDAMVPRDDDGCESGAGPEMDVGVQVVLGLFLMSAFVALVWFMFGGS